MEVPSMRRSEGLFVGRKQAGREATMEKESSTGNCLDAGITKGREVLTHRETGKRYVLLKILKDGLVILKCEDGVSSMMTNETSLDFYFMLEHTA